MNVMCEKTTDLSETVLNLSTALQYVFEPTVRDAIYATIFRLCATIDASLATQNTVNK